MQGEISYTKNWASYLEKLETYDVFWDLQYFLLYKLPNQEVECIVYEKGQNFLILPYLKTKLTYQEESFFDLESPHGYSGPITNTSDQSFLNEASAEILKSLRENNFIAAFIRFHPIFKNESLLQWGDGLKQNNQTVVVDLKPSLEEIWKEQIHSKHRNSIRKAEASLLTFEADHTFDSLNDFVPIYQETMDKLMANESYRYEKQYYEHLKQSFAGESFLANVKLNGKTISSAIILVKNKIANYHLAGSLQEFLELSPNNFLIYKIIEHLKACGIQSFHLGGGGAKKSLFDFKKRFSNSYPDYFIGQYIIDEKKYKLLTSEWDLKFSASKPQFKNFFLRYRL